MNLSRVAALSGIYDIAVGIILLAGRHWLATTMGVPLPVPPIHVDLNALFLLVIGAGYWLPYRHPQTFRAYMWLMGPLLKGAGAVVFVLDHLLRGSPPIFLLFALSDGALALLTLAVLISDRRA
jgi:hypothetical protein